MRGIFSLLILLFLALSINLISCNNENDITKKTSDEIETEIDKALEDTTTSSTLQIDEVESSTGGPDNEEKPSIDEQISEVMQNTAEGSPQLKNIGNAKKGKELFINTCASCHGMDGHGDGVAAASLDPKPRNLSDNNYVSELSDNHLFRVISLGGVSVGKSALMPPWGGILTEDEIWHIISHIRKNICNCTFIETPKENLQ